MLALYQATSTHLSIARTRFDDISLANELSRRIGTARGVIYQRRRASSTEISGFFTNTFPLAARRCRNSILFVMGLLFLPALAIGIWMTNHPEVRELAVPTSTQELIANGEFADYYSSNPAESWAFELFTHNITVAVKAFGGALAGGVFGIYQILQESVRLGSMAAVMHAYGHGTQFWGLILPHGLIELTAVCVATGAGLHVVWSVLVPGRRPRSRAAAEEGMVAITVLIGAMLMFVVAGFTEAFVTPSGLPTVLRVGIGVINEVLALTWMFGVHRFVNRSESNLAALQPAG